jgi:hypothetical protein
MGCVTSYHEVRIIRPLIPRFKDVISGYACMIFNGWDLSHRNADLITELEFRHTF